MFPNLARLCNFKFRHMAGCVYFLIVIFLNFLVDARNDGATHIHNDNHERTVVKIGNNYSVTRSNYSKFAKNSSYFEKSSSNVIDCFGLGTSIAQILQWWFTINDNSANGRDVRFFLTSRKKRRRVQVLAGEQFGLEWTDFKVERRTVFIVHGFLSHGNTSWSGAWRRLFCCGRNDVNVVVVDWAARGNTLNYYKAVVNTRNVGNEIARFLDHIVNATIAASSSNETKWGTLHLVGHSLGAHICGFAASNFKRRQDKWRVARITGLDPALPCFDNVTSMLRLDRTDAPFVDVIHTNGKLGAWFGFGLPHSIGHVDYYPNGGKTQLGCSPVDNFFDFIPIPKPMLDQAICSHGRSYLYLIESLVSASSENCTFWGQHWDRSYRRALRLLSESCDANNCTEMGIKAENYPQRGTFFVATSRVSPFCVMESSDKEELREQLKIDYANEILD